MLILLIAIPLHRIVIFPGFAHKQKTASLLLWLLWIFKLKSMRLIQEQSDSQQMNWVAFFNVTPAAVYAAFITYSFL